MIKVGYQLDLHLSKREEHEVFVRKDIIKLRLDVIIEFQLFFCVKYKKLHFIVGFITERVVNLKFRKKIANLAETELPRERARI